MKTPTLNDFLNVLSDASQNHEGWFDGSASVANNNPGNLKFVGQANATASPKGFAVFDTFYHGKQAHVADLAAKMNAGYIDKTLTDLFAHYLGSDANPTEVSNYVSAVVSWFRAMGWTVNDGIAVSQIIANQTKPAALICVNEISKPAEWYLAQNTIKGFAGYAHDFCAVTRYSNHHFTTFMTYQYPDGNTAQGVAIEEVQSVLGPVNEGQEFNLCLISSVVYGTSVTVGGDADEIHAVSVQQPNTVYGFVVLQEDLQSLPTWTDIDARAMFHEIIHEIFGRCGDRDTLHAYLLANGGYYQNTAKDLLAVYQQESQRFFLMHQEVSKLQLLINFLEQLIAKK